MNPQEDAVIKHIKEWLIWSSTSYNKDKGVFVYKNAPNFNYGHISNGTGFYTLVFDIRGNLYPERYQQVLDIVNAYPNVRCEIGKERETGNALIILVKEDWQKNFLETHKRSSQNIDYETKNLELSNRPIMTRSFCVLL
jgi:hypothetical protein